MKKLLLILLCLPMIGFGQALPIFEKWKKGHQNNVERYFSDQGFTYNRQKMKGNIVVYKGVSAKKQSSGAEHVYTEEEFTFENTMLSKCIVRYITEASFDSDFESVSMQKAFTNRWENNFK